MTLQEMSKEYAASAELIRQRLRTLRRELENQEDPEQIFLLKRRIIALSPMLTQMNELAELTAHYYDKGYYRDERYTI